MAIEIPVPDLSVSEINITLSGISYDFVFRENSRENSRESGRLYLDIYINDSLLKGGIKIMENQPLIARYVLDDFLHGELFCLRKTNTLNEVVRSNIGLSKDYGLYYLTNEELEE